MVDHYIPGHNAGGPIRSISNLVEALGDEFNFLIITTDRDYKANRPYEGIAPGTWLPTGKAKVMYLSPRGLTIRNMLRLIRNTGYDLLYINSFFSRRFSMLPCLLGWLGMISSTPILLAPRGEFSPGAIKIKRGRKKIYLWFSRLLGIHRKIKWHASSDFEKKDIIREFGKNIMPSTSKPSKRVNLNKTYVRGNSIDVIVANNISNYGIHLYYNKNNYKLAGSVRFLFLSRISPMKNLDMAIELLNGLKGDIQYHIYGPIGDKNYWNQCNKRIETMASNIKIFYKGEVPHEQTYQVFSQYDFFLLPTRGENYGHVIIESLQAGCPVIISDQTPWRNLETSGVGWDLSLEDRDALRSVLQKCVDMNADEYDIYSNRAMEYAVAHGLNPEILEQNRNLFKNPLNFLTVGQ